MRDGLQDTAAATNGARFEFEILDADPRRVKRLRVRRIERAPEADEASPAAGK